MNRTLTRRNCCELDLRFFVPPADLEHSFTLIYRLTIDKTAGKCVEDALQPEWANLRFFAYNAPVVEALDGTLVDGARFQATGPSILPTRFCIGQTRMWGIALSPLGWARYVRLPAHEHVNSGVDGEKSEVFSRFAPLCDIVCDPDGDDDDQFEQIVAFFRDLAPPPRDAARITAIHQALVDPRLTKVHEFAEKACLTTRTLERLCLRHFGLPPQMLLRRQRVMRSLNAFMQDPEAGWANTMDGQYHDHSHFVHEFQAFMQMTPSEYAAMPHPVFDAFMAERRRIWGTPSRSLERIGQPQGDQPT